MRDGGRGGSGPWLPLDINNESMVGKQKCKPGGLNPDQKGDRKKEGKELQERKFFSKKAISKS